MHSVFAEAAPHPNPLPAKSGEREKRRAANFCRKDHADATRRVCALPLLMHTRLSGASGARHSLRPLNEEGGTKDKTSRETRGENAKSYVAVMRPVGRKDETVAATAVRSLSRLRGRAGVGVPDRKWMLLGRQFPPPAALWRARRPPPQAGEVAASPASRPEQTTCYPHNSLALENENELTLSCHRPRRRAIQYSRDAEDGIERPRRTGSPACAGDDDLWR